MSELREQMRDILAALISTVAFESRNPTAGITVNKAGNEALDEILALIPKYKQVGCTKDVDIYTDFYSISEHEIHGSIGCKPLFIKVGE